METGLIGRPATLDENGDIRSIAAIYSLFSATPEATFDVHILMEHEISTWNPQFKM